jgi:hypothetical protein
LQYLFDFDSYELFEILLIKTFRPLIKKFLLPFQNMIRADLFSGSLAVWNFLDGAIRIFCPLDPSRAERGEDRIPFELFLIYTARRAPFTLYGWAAFFLLKKWGSKATRPTAGGSRSEHRAFSGGRADLRRGRGKRNPTLSARTGNLTLHGVFCSVG